MIHLTLPWFVFIYLIVFLAGILSFWIGYEMLQQRLSSRDSSCQQVCRICGASFRGALRSSRSGQKLVHCSSCGSLHELNHQGGL